MRRRTRMYLFILAGLLVLLSILAGFAALFTPSGVYSFQVYDTYLVVSPWNLVLPVYLFISFAFLLISVIVLRFSDKSINWMLVGFTGALVLGCSPIMVMISGWVSQWVIYPPLSAMENGFEPDVLQTWTGIHTGLILLQVLLLVILVWAVYKSR